jgi:hypothetical protein
METYQMLFLSVEIEPFLASFGSWCIPTPYLDGWIIPPDKQWQDELGQRGISFTIIEVIDNAEN